MPFIVFKPINFAFKVCYPSIFHLCPSAIKKAPKVNFLDSNLKIWTIVGVEKFAIALHALVVLVIL